MLLAEQLQVPSAPIAVNLRVTVDTSSDHDLMLAVRAGEIQRLGVLFERYQRPLYGFFVRLTNQPAISEDLVQIVFQRILKYRHTYRDEGKFSAWIYHLARKVAADYFRKQSTAAAATDPADLVEYPDTHPPPSEHATTVDDLRLLRTALAQLPLAHREVLVLARLQHLEYKEIARLLDCSVGAVKVRVHRALQELRVRYGKIRRDAAA